MTGSDGRKRPYGKRGEGAERPGRALSRLRQHLHEADTTGRVAAEIDPVRIVRINVDTARIRLRFRQREFDPFLRLGLETGDLSDLVLAPPAERFLPALHHPI